MWRPKNWVNYCGKGFKYGGWSPPDEYTRRVCAGIYETGADIILTHLLSSGLITISQLEELNKNGENRYI